MEALIKEVYARFGLAYYLGEVLHRDLCNVYALLGFENDEDITRPRVEEKLAYAFSQTLGVLIRLLKDILHSELNSQLQIALEKRNFLAHHFWYGRIHLMFSEQGLIKMIDELDRIGEFFNDLSLEANKIMEPRRIELGVSDEEIHHLMMSLSSGILDEPIPHQRSPKKQEKLVKVWDMKTNDNIVYHIFEMEDGTFWQLCDVGLGWSCFKTHSSGWLENQAINRFLPANINPRPIVSRSWNYEFLLKERMVLWVRPGESEMSYNWGLRKATYGHLKDK